MIAVALGYNDLHVTLGVFESESVAREKLLLWGAVEMQFPVYERGVKTDKLGAPRLVTTQAFVEYMQAKGLSTYSTGAGLEEHWPFQFIPIQLNELCIGYNDD